MSSKPSPVTFKEMLEGLVERARAVRSRQVDPSEDNMLFISPTMVVSWPWTSGVNLLPEHPGSKATQLVQGTYNPVKEMKKALNLLFVNLRPRKGQKEFNVMMILKETGGQKGALR